MWSRTCAPEIPSRNGPVPTSSDSPARHLVHERHARLVRSAAEREPDQQRHHQRIEDQQAEQQRGAQQDAQVLGEQRAQASASGLARRRNATKADSRSPRARRRPVPASSRGRPQNRRLAVGQHQHAVGVALRLRERVRRVHAPSCRRSDRPPRYSHRRSRWRGSSAALGSSSSSTGGLRRAGRSRRSAAGGCRPTAARPDRPRARAARSASSIRATLPSTSATLLERANRRRFSADRELVVDGRGLRHPAGAGSAARTVPASAGWMPARIVSRVVLPAPFGPDAGDPLPGARLERDVLQRLACAVALAQSLRCKHDGRRGHASCEVNVPSGIHVACQASACCSSATSSGSRDGPPSRPRCPRWSSATSPTS